MSIEKLNVYSTRVVLSHAQDEDVWQFGRTYPMHSEAVNSHWARKSKINLNKELFKDPNVLSEILKQCKNLKAVTLRKERKGDFSDSVAAITTHCQILESLELPGTNLSRRNLRSLGSKCSSLKSLSIRFDDRGSALKLGRLFSKNSGLEDINLINLCKNINDTNGHCLKKLPKTIKHLRLNGYWNLDCLVLIECIKNWNIETLALYPSLKFTNGEGFLHQLEQAAPNLQKLSFSCVNFPLETLNSLQNFSQLKFLCLTNVQNSHLTEIETIVDNFVALEVFHLENMWFKPSRELITSLARLPNLREISIGEVPFSELQFYKEMVDIFKSSGSLTTVHLVCFENSVKEVYHYIKRSPFHRNKNEEFNEEEPFGWFTKHDLLNNSSTILNQPDQWTLSNMMESFQAAVLIMVDNIS